MTTIAAENRKTLRQAMVVQCGFRETDTEPTELTPTGNLADYEPFSNMDPAMLTDVLMDLAGSGFLNDGNADPMHTDSDSYRYGYISNDAALEDGTFLQPFGVVVEAANNWDVVTIEVRGQYGTRQIKQVNPTWLNGQATILVDKWTPGERAYITGVFLGLTWLWSNDDLISVDLDLHGVNTQIGGELEISSIEIQAYETTDYTDVLGKIPFGSPIWYAAGYPGDMSTTRNFYLSEVASWENNILTIRGQDATSLIEGNMVPWQWYSRAAGTNILYPLRDMVESNALAGISFTRVGIWPSLTYGSKEQFHFESMAPRTILSRYCDLFRDADYIRITYVDAGIPTLSLVDYSNTFTIYADEIADLKTIVEQNINSISADVVTFEESDNYEEYTRIDAVANRTYFVDFDSPVTSLINTPNAKSREWIGYRTWKFVAQYTDEYVISVKKLETILEDGDNPYTVLSSVAGVGYSYDYEIPAFLFTGGSVTKSSLAALLNRSNILYEFTYRGNPHIQPRDILNVEVARWVTEYITIDGLYPETDLYPAADLYPYAQYKEIRKIVKEWIQMTVDTLTLEHTEGGLVSKIKARKGAV